MEGEGDGRREGVGEGEAKSDGEMGGYLLLHRLVNNILHIYMYGVHIIHTRTHTRAHTHTHTHTHTPPYVLC